MISLKHIRNALLVEEHGNFHRAAQAAHISQSALSRSIQALEQQLGVTLFDRGSGAIEPTLFGRAVLERASTILNETAELQREISLLKGLGTGSLRVAAGAYPVDLSAGRAMGELIARHSELQCRLQLASWREVAELVGAGAVDLGIAEISTLETSDELIIEPIGSHPVALFARRGHPMSRVNEQISIEALNEFPTVSIRIPPRASEAFPGRSESDPVSGDLVPSVEVDDLASAISVVTHSNAFGVAAFVQIEPWVQRGDVSVLQFSADWLRLHYGFIYRRRRMLSPAATVYMALVRDIEEEVDRCNRTLQQAMLGGR